MLWQTPSMLTAALALLCGTACADLVVSNCDDSKSWRGGQPETALVKEGTGAIRWTPSEEVMLSCSAIPHDWSSGNCLQFWLHSAKATGSTLWLVINSEDKSKEGPDYYLLQFPNDWTGWRHFVVPFDEIGAVRSPIGWSKIDNVVLHAAWNPQVKANPEDRFVLDDVRVLTGPSQGPRMSDEDLFDALDLSRPGLEKVRDAAQARDWTRAKAAFRDYFLARRNVKWFRNWWERAPRPEKRPNTGSADESLKHIYTFDRKKYDLGPDIDWASNQRNEGEAATVEWNAALNRHFFLSGLAAAYEQTGEERYAEEVMNLMTDWVRKCPVLMLRSGNGPYHYAWETLNTACRAGDTWIEGLWRTADSPAWTPDALCTVVKSLAEHARHLVKWPSRGNWLTAESKAVTIVATLLPEFKEADEWRRIGIERLYRQMDDEVYPDGLENELAMGYNLWVLRNYSDILDLAILNDRRAEIPSDYQARIEKMYNYLLYAMAPNGMVPGLNDSGNANPTSYLEKAFAYFPERKDFQWGATRGKEGQVPAATSYPFPYTGHYILRSGWDSQAQYLLFDAGPFGSGHQHEDKLNVLMQAQGREWIVEGGTYMYDHSRWRRYVLSTRGHNTARIDGMDQSRRTVRSSFVLPYPFEPLGNPWVSNAEFDYVAGSYEDGYGDKNEMKVTHRREILFVKPAYWILIDTFEPADNQPHEYQTIFHINAVEATAAGTAVSAEEGGKHLGLVGFGDGLGVSVVKGLTEEPVQGWANSPWRAVPTALFTNKAAGRVQNVYVLYPSDKPGTPKVSAVAGGARGCLRLDLPDGQVHLLALAPTGNAAQPIATDAPLCLLKLDAAGQPGGVFALNGTYVKYAGADLLPARP